jgi:hypothetical protein
VYVRQSSRQQVIDHGESTRLQYGRPRVFRTVSLGLIHAADCRFRNSWWTSYGVL